MKQRMSPEQVRAKYNYDPETGTITFAARPAGGPCEVGDTVGGVNKEGYLRTKSGGRQYMIHQLAYCHFHGEWAPEQIDHIDGNRRNNCISNLRAATCAQNNQNRGIAVSNSSGVQGVSWCSRTKQWKAYIRRDFRKGSGSYHLGYYDNLEDAKFARECAKEALHKFHPAQVTRQACPPQ